MKTTKQSLVKLKDLKLFRVELTFKYLYLTDASSVSIDDAQIWLKEIHNGEFDGAFEVKQVRESSEVDDFEDDYGVYIDPQLTVNPVINGDLLLGDLKEELRLDIPEMIEKVRAAGYTVTKLR